MDFDGTEKDYIVNVDHSKTQTKQFTIYPNPSSGSFQLILNHNGLKKNSIIIITDTKGNVVMTKPVDVKSGYNLYVISKNLSAGIYYVLATDGNSSTGISKLIIQ